MYIGCLGDMVFETSATRVLTPAFFSQEQEARYEDHQVQGEVPRSEFLSPDLAGFSLDICLSASLGPDPLALAEQLNASCRQGRVLRLVLAGRNLGRVTIRSVSQDWRHARPGGQGVQLVWLRLRLKEYL